MAGEECRSCRAPVTWAEKFPAELNDRGLPKTVPVDAGSHDDPNGTLAVWRDGGVLRARYLKKGEEPAQGQHRGISHFATCPSAAQWRSR